MDPHTQQHHQHQQQLITAGHNTTWGQTSSLLLENNHMMMASMMEDHQQHQHQHQHQHHLSSLNHHSVWQSSSSSDYYNNYMIPFSQPNQIMISSPSSASLFFAGSTATAHHQHQLTLDDYHDNDQYNHVREQEQQEGRDRIDLVADGNEEDEADEEGADDQEELSAMKEMMYKIAAMQPVDIDPSTIRKPKRRNVRISDDPQSVAARHRRERISEKMRILQRLVPGGTKMDTSSMLDEAIRYVKFLKRQIKHLQQDQNHPHQLPPSLKSCLNSTCVDDDHHLTVTMANKQQQQQQQQQQHVRFVAAASIMNTTSVNINTADLPHHHDHRPAEESSLDIVLNSSTTSNKLMHYSTDNSSTIVHTQQMDIFNQFLGITNDMIRRQAD